MTDKPAAPQMTDELTELVAKALCEVDIERWGDGDYDMPNWDTDRTAYVAMAREAIAVVRQWDAGK